MQIAIQQIERRVTAGRRVPLRDVHEDPIVASVYTRGEVMEAADRLLEGNTIFEAGQGGGDGHIDGSGREALTAMAARCASCWARPIR